MSKKFVRWFLGLSSLLIVITVFVLAFIVFPPIGANILLHPYKKPLTESPKGAHDVSVRNEHVELKGWEFNAQGRFRGTVIYLHGISDNRAGVLGIAKQFVSLGYDVRGFDSRAHGESGGEYCTYGYHEKGDLMAIVEDCRSGPIVLIGTSMGGAVAAQAASEIEELEALILLDTFSDLSVVIRDRVPSAVPDIVLGVTKKYAERIADFRVEEVSPRKAAKSIDVPTLVIHGGADVETPPDHAQKIFNNLRGRKDLIIVEGAGHCEAGSYPETWKSIKRWVLDQTG